MAIRRRGTRWTVKVYDPSAPGKQRWIGSFESEAETVDAERAATLGIAPSARARTIRDWSMVWLRDYARPAPATQRTYRYAVERIVETPATSCCPASIGPLPVVWRPSGPTTPRASRAQCSAMPSATD
jgi:hypothetical protein